MGGALFKYFDKYEIAWIMVLVPSLCVGIMQIIMLGFTLNLYCYHRWLRKNDLTTLEHIFKHKNSKKPNQVMPKDAPKSEQGTEKETERLQLRTGRPQSGSKMLSSKDEGSAASQKDNDNTGKNSISESVSIGRPKSTLHQAQEYFNQQSRLTVQFKAGSMKNMPSRSKFMKNEPKLVEPTCKEEAKKTVLRGEDSGFLPKIQTRQLMSKIVERNESELNMDVKEKTEPKKISKRKLPPLALPAKQ